MPARRAHEPRLASRWEASLGQVVRGGRSWPSETKLGGGAWGCGKTAVIRCGSARLRELLTMPVTEQDAAQRLHLSDAPA